MFDVLNIIYGLYEEVKIEDKDRPANEELGTSVCVP